MSKKGGNGTKVRRLKLAKRAVRNIERKQIVREFLIIEATARSAGDTLTNQEAARMIYDMSGAILDFYGVRP